MQRLNRWHLQPGNNIARILHQLVQVGDLTTFGELIQQVGLEVPQFVGDGHIFQTAVVKVALQATYRENNFGMQHAKYKTCFYANQEAKKSQEGNVQTM